MTTDERVAVLRTRVMSLASEARGLKSGSGWPDSAGADAKVALIEQAEDALDNAAALLARSMELVA